MLNLEQLRANLAAKTNTKTTTVKSDSPFFPFWKMDYGQSVVIRLINDGDTSNEFLHVERRMVTLPFAGVVGKPAAGSPVTVEVPSLTTWDARAKDPIVEATRAYWDKEDGNIELARMYHYKRTFLYQGLVVGGDLVEEGRENEVRIFSFNKPLHDTISSEILDPDLEWLVTEDEHGRDLRITKTKKGEFAAYDASFAKKERPLTDAEREAIKDGGFKLKDHLPTKPDTDLLQAMFDSSFASEEFDPERFPNFYYREASGSKLAEDLR